MPILPEGVKEVAHWLKFHASLKDRIILGSDAWNTTDQDIVARSGLSLRNFLVVTTPLVPGAEINLDKHIEGYIVDKRPRYLILNSTGFLNKILGFDMNQETQHKFGCNFNLLFSKSLEGYEIFNIYEISYDDL
jgi:hypothetical protein